MRESSWQYQQRAAPLEVPAAPPTVPDLVTVIGPAIVRRRLAAAGMGTEPIAVTPLPSPGLATTLVAGRWGDAMLPSGSTPGDDVDG